METGEIRFQKTVTLGVREIIDLNYVQFRKLLALSVPVGAVSLALSVLLRRMDAVQNEHRVRLMLYLGVFILIFTPLMFAVSTFVSVRQNKKLCIPMTYAFGENAFSQTSDAASSVIAYSMIERAVAFRGCAYLYINKASAYVVPLSGFEIGDAGAFPAFLTEKMGKRMRYIGRRVPRDAK